MKYLFSAYYMSTWKSKTEEMRIMEKIPTHIQVYVNTQIFHALYSIKAQMHISQIQHKVKMPLKGLTRSINYPPSGIDMKNQISIQNKF